jgi:hypothetical protein
MLIQIYKLIQENPEYFAWIFALLNFLWGAFLFFNKKRHDREIINLKASLSHSNNLEFEKRRKLFEMKATQFEKYFKLVDAFGKKHSVDMPRKMQPITAEYFESYLKAETENDQAASNAAITRFGAKVNELLSDGLEDYLAIQSETNSLKLIATDELAKIFSSVEKQYAESFELSQEFMNQFVSMFVKNEQEKIALYEEKMKLKANELKDSLLSLMNKMREELNQI